MKKIEIVSAFSCSVAGRATITVLFLFYTATASAFDCGPHVLTYVVSNTDGAPAGIRCVKFTYHSIGSDGLPFYQFDWYGEGYRDAGTYRHIGTAMHFGYEFNNATAVNIFGNGEVFKGVATNLLPEITDASTSPTEIRIWGEWNETWTLATNIAYTPLPRPQVCGPNFVTYEVKEPNGTGPVVGIRCVHEFYWYGTGSWGGGGYYTHVGSGGVSSLTSGGLGGAWDMCSSSDGQTCNNFPYSSIVFTPTSDNKGFHVTGAWNEYWHIPQPPKPPVPEFDICDRKPSLPQCIR